MKKKLSRIAHLISNPILLKAKKENIELCFAEEILNISKKFYISPNTIFDIGAAKGEWTKAARLFFPEANYLCFEPIPKFFEELKNNFSNCQNIKLYNYALSSESGTKIFYLNEFAYSSSLRKMTQEHVESFPFTEKFSEIPVTVKKISDLDLELKKPIYCKIDVQGAEIDVLQGFGKFIEEVDFFQLEISFKNFYESCPSYIDIMQYMYKHGFRSIYQVSAKTSKKENCVHYADYLFLK